ncbi:plasmid replication protein RepC [Sulfitobacter litoralis]|nr:plasmid replication protein RepC [Sulfitobacter litoralis]
MDQLTQAAETYELSHRTLTVLQALLTFLPSRHIPTGPAGIVFASNQRLSERLHGMPESTLRRHLAQLLRAGIVSRHDSPNRKRFARNRGGEITAAFGFNLAPMVHQADAIGHAAGKAQARQEELLALRDEVLMLRAELMRQTGHETELAELAKLLRRKSDEAELQSIVEKLKNLLESGEETVLVAEETSTAYIQNERHIQDSDIIHFDSEGQGAHTSDTFKCQRALSADKVQAVSLSQVLTACQEHQYFFPESLRTWSDLERISDKIAPMLGIDQPVMIEAKRIMGAEAAAVTVLCMLEKANAIRSPGAYLRRLTQMAHDGAFTLQPMLMALANRQIVS